MMMKPSELPDRPQPAHDPGRLRRFASEERTLRQIADLVARASRAEDVFEIAASEASRQLDGEAVTLTRFAGAGELVVVATHGGPAPVGTRIDYDPGTLPDRVRQQKGIVRVDDYRAERDAPLASRFGLRASVAVPVMIEGAVWGTFTATSIIGPLPHHTESRLEDFAQLVATTIANIEAREELRAIAQHDAAIRLLAEQSVRGHSTKIALLMTVDHAMTLRGVAHAAIGLHPLTPTPPREFPTPSTQQRRTVSYPIRADDRLWARLDVEPLYQVLPDETHAQLTDLAQVAGRAVSAILTRLHLRHLADEQSALHRIAELIARGATPSDVFAAIAAELSRLLGDAAVVVLRFDADGPVAAATCRSVLPVGTRIPVDEPRPGQQRGPTSIEDLDTVRRAVFGSDPTGANTTSADATGSIAVPITVAGQPAGALLVKTRPEAATTPGTDTPGPNAPGAAHLEAFADLAAAVTANARTREALLASRARIITAANDARRQLQRDVHDGAQQRLVHTILALKLARDRAANGESPAALIQEALTHAEEANRQLRDLVRGILPASLTRGGLVAGVQSFVDDLPVPVSLNLSLPRLSPTIETTGYFSVAEGITNAIKHAHADHVDVEAWIDSENNLQLQVRDDGMGGADPTRGTGLTGLTDRIEAGGGRITITSPPGLGTSLSITLPLDPRTTPSGTGRARTPSHSRFA